MQFEYSTDSVTQVVGATVRMVDYWARKGVLRPSGQKASGKGTKRRWTFHDIVALQAILALRRGGCPLQTIRKVIRHLASHYPHKTPSEVLSRVVLITDGKRVLMTDGDRQAMDVLSHQAVFCIPLGSIILRTTEQIDSMRQQRTETIILGGQSFQIEVARENAHTEFVARCRELPGAMGRSDSPETAFAQVKNTITTYLEMNGNSRRRPLRRDANLG